MLSEETEFLVRKPEVRREVVRRRRIIERHPRTRSLVGALALVPTDLVSEDQFRRIVDESPSLEKLVILVNRPALFIKNDSYEIPVSDVWFARLTAARASIERAIRATGRIELRQARDAPYIGTGWLIAPNVVVTNRHVALEFARHSRNGGVAFRTDPVGRRVEPVLDFREEYRQRAESLEIELSQVLFMTPDDDRSPDVAFLKVKPGQRLPEPIPLSEAPLQVGHPVAAIGYPAYDPHEIDRQAMVDIFNGIFDVKRLSPGEVMVPARGRSWHFRHDCATLGGNSGSAILGLETGGAAGLHFSGTSRVGNFAVTASTIRRLLKQLPDVTVPPSTPVITTTSKSVTEAEEKASARGYADREGYIVGFLGDDTRVPLPTPTDTKRSDLAPLKASAGHELKYRHFSIVMSKGRGFPMITGVNIDGTSLRRIPRSNGWKLDPRIAADHQAGENLYRNNSLDKGHMVRRLDPVWGPIEQARQANEDTFHFTNSCPQDHTFNDEIWGDLEDYILDSAPDDLRLSVLTGPILDDDDPEYRGLRIPRSFWKLVAWKAGSLKTAAFLLTQEEYLDNLEFNPYRFGTVQTTVREVGRRAQLRFGRLVSADVLSGQEAVRPFRVLNTVEDVTIK